MHLLAIQWAMVVGQILFSGLILEIMVRKKFRSTFPFFFNFIIFSLATLLLLLPLIPRVSASMSLYFVQGVLGLGTIFTFGVMYEMFLNILKPYPALMDLGALLFRWAVAFLALASVLTAITGGGHTPDKIVTGAQRSCDLMQCGLLLLLALLESRLGLSWRSPTIVIMAGLGANGLLDLITVFLRSQVPSWNVALNLLTEMAGLITYIAWYGSFALPQPSRRSIQDSPTRLILQRWNEVLVDTPLLGDKNTADVTVASVESFLPGVEKTVERIMAGKMTH
jgi:hypothetical protein